MTSRLCSITTTVLPFSTSSCSTSSGATSDRIHARRRLVQKQHLSAPASTVRLASFHALRFAARQCRRLLSDLDVAEPDALQHFHLVAHRGHRLEERSRLVHRHFQHVGDGLVLELHFQRLAVVAVPVAGIAFHIDVRQEVHLDLDDAIALADLAASALHVEREASRLDNRARLSGSSANQSRMKVNEPV